jgi:hypothetical protein
MRPAPVMTAPRCKVHQGLEPSCHFFVSTATRGFYRGISANRPHHPQRGRRTLGERGRGTLALNDEKKTRRKTGGKSSGEGDGSADRDVGHALRSVYAKTVSEDIPNELLDLLGKLS